MGQVELKGVDLLVTQKCTSRCKHCSYRSSPSATERMTARDAEKYVDDASRFGIEWIWVGGGEPFLCREVLPYIARAAKKACVLDVWVVTNGYWASNPDLALRELRMLSEAGVTILGLSIDAFHQEYIPLQRVRNVLAVAREAGFRRIEVSGQFLGSVDSDIEFNRTTEANLSLLEQEGFLDGVKVGREVLRLCGRAADLLTPYLPAQSEEALRSARCDPKWLPIESLRRLRAVEIDWQGNVTTCPGIRVGNAHQESLQKILGEYNYHDHPIIKILLERGPYGLLQLAKSNGYAPHKGGYSDACHMCFEARRYLVHLYPNHLTPATCYTEYSSLEKRLHAM